MINCDLQATGKASRLLFCTHVKVLGPSKTLLVGLDSRAGSREKHETRVSRFSRDPARGSRPSAHALISITYIGEK